MSGQPRYDVDDVPVRVHRQIRGGWGRLAPQIFGFGHYIPSFQPSARAACSGTDPDCFFPEDGHWGGLAIARRICAGCPIRSECLNWALENKEVHGIWGGTTYRQRQRIWTAQEGKELR